MVDFDAVITDIEMPGMSGVAVTKMLPNEYPGPPILIMGGSPEIIKLDRRVEGARDFI